MLTDEVRTGLAINQMAVAAACLHQPFSPPAHRKGGTIINCKSLKECVAQIATYTSKYKKLLISKRRIGILKKLPKQGEDSESL